MSPENKETMRQKIYIKLVGQTSFPNGWDSDKISETCDYLSRIASIAVNSYDEEQDEINYFVPEATKDFEDLIDEHIPQKHNEEDMYFAVGHSFTDHLFGPYTLQQALNCRHATTKPLYIFNLKTKKAEYFFSPIEYKFVRNET